MKNSDWLSFFQIATDVLGVGSRCISRSQSFCAWTTFSALESTCNYWRGGLPDLKDLDIRGHNDGGVWGQPFDFEDLAHIIIPASFEAEIGCFRNQKIRELSKALNQRAIKHEITDLLLEIKLY